MRALDPNTPVIVGVGQFSERPDEQPYAALSPMDLAGRALRAAIEDCRADSPVAPAIDTIAAIRQFEISSPVAVAPFGKSNNPPRSIGRRVGADPARAILEVVGGQGPQKLVGELAADIASGRSSLAAIVGSEAISTTLRLAKSESKPAWSEEIGGDLEDRGYGMGGLVDRTLLDHGLAGAIPNYALFENARRARESLSPDEYRMKIGELFAPFTKVAAANPHAAAPVERSASELAEVTERNRIVAEPYPRMTVARDQVNQAAAIILASTAKAAELGIPEELWVHVHAVADAHEASVLERVDMAVSPASIASVGESLNIAGIDMPAIGVIDLYSCFAIPVFNILDAFGIDPGDSRGLTLTGGLPFFGGAGNNYSGHAIAEAVKRLRSSPGAYGLVGANGGYMSKYATGIYSTKPADWSAGSRFCKLPCQAASVTVLDCYRGRAKVETYTVVPGKRGTLGAVVARTPAGERVLATAGDETVLAELQCAEAFGRVVEIMPGGERRNAFAFRD